MKPDPRLIPYAHSSNEPLPDHLRAPLNGLLYWLDQQDQACKRERQRIRETIEDKESIIQTLECEIQRLKRVQESLYLPYVALPPEIIAKIIAFVINDTHGFVGRTERRDFQSIRSVCQQWRHVAISTSTLWRSVQLEPADLSLSYRHRTDRALQSWFMRGGQNTCLRLSLSSITPEAAQFLFGALYSCTARLSSVVVDIERHYQEYGGSDEFQFLVTPSSEGSNHTLPLQNLGIRLQRPEIWERARSRNPLDLTNRLPQLSHLSLSFGKGRVSTPCPASFIHGTLLSLSLHRVQLLADETVLVLGGLPRLEKLCLSECGPFLLDSTEAAAAPPYVCSSLERLDVYHTIPGPFISGLVCPSLKELVVVRKRSESREVEIAWIQRFMARCGGSSIQLIFSGKVPGTTQA
ncbi:hypothetical protein BKA70DRAFT_1450268 [Coprinopsis sp. MPI-PUGE-AT-0042]|nr:hypothetical protein BKA70DRAFT_1450268 [Coprinopsis sp. MPI-PUGE-AT-0042]